MNTGTLSIQMRPQSFDEVLGQSTVIAAIREQIASGRLPYGWLFSGSAGVGKTTVALILAKELGVAAAREVNGADFGVDDARALVEEASLCPLSGVVRGFIIDEAQKATDAAQQLLLKPLENSPSSVFIFCTTDESKIIKPLRDRCLGFTFKGVAGQDRRDLIDRAFQYVSTPNSATKAVITRAIEDAALESPREILMAVERCIGGMAPKDAVRLDEHKPEYIDIARAVAKGDWLKASATLLSLKAADARGVRSVVAAYLRSMLLKASGEQARRTISECIFGLGQHQSPDTALDWSLLTAALYRVASKMGKPE